MMSSNTMRTATENANMTGNMSGAAAEKHMPDATGPSQPANAEASGRPASSRRASSMYRLAKLTVFGSLKAELLKLWSLNSTKVLLGIVRVERLECDLHGVYGFEHWQDAGQSQAHIRRRYVGGTGFFRLDRGAGHRHFRRDGHHQRIPHISRAIQSDGQPQARHVLCH